MHGASMALTMCWLQNCLQLMGKERNKPLAERDDKPLRYYDREVCKYNLCGLCPNMLFTNTKSYLGEWGLGITRSASCYVHSLTPAKQA
jgi:LUC7 N_terminus